MFNKYYIVKFSGYVGTVFTMSASNSGKPGLLLDFLPEMGVQKNFTFLILLWSQTERLKSWYSQLSCLTSAFKKSNLEIKLSSSLAVS